jgi:hypothetical protein
MIAVRGGGRAGFVRDIRRESMTPSFSFGRGKRSLAISIGERSLRLAEVIWDTEAAPAARMAEFVYPESGTLEEPGQLGGALASFLKEQGFSAHRAIFGVPAKWLIVRPYEMPPTDAHTASSILWLHTTDQIMPALGPMVFDFMGESSPTEPRTLLLVGLQRRWMERLMALAAAARLKVVGITPIGAAVGAATAAHVPNSLIALFGPEGAELIEQEGRHTRSMRPIRSNGSVQPVIAELRRAAAAMSLDVDLPPHLRPGLVLWDDKGLEPEFVNALRQATSLPVTEAQRQWVGISESNAPDSTRGLSAIALTLSQRAEQRPGIDFLNPRLAAPRGAHWHDRAAWLPWAVAAIVFAAVALFVDISSIQKQISGMDHQLQAMQPALDVATPYVARMQFAESFRAVHPRYLACLGDLTEALPADGQTYLTSLNLRTDMRGDVSGHSTNEQNVLTLRDKLNSIGRFAELMCKLDAMETRGSGSDVSFSITFIYLPRK